MHWYFPGSPLSRLSLTVARRDWDRFTGCATAPRFICLLLDTHMHETAPKPCACGAGSHSSYRGNFVFGWVLHLLLKRGTKMEECLMPCHDADINSARETFSKSLLSFLINK